MTKLISIVSAIMILQFGGITADLYIRHEQVREAIRGCDEIIIEEAETPAEATNEAIATPSEGVGRITPVPKYNATGNELEKLVTLCYLEAGGESDAVIRCIVEVVFNRLASGIWGETLTDVIYATGEFDPAPYIADFETGGNLIIEDKLDVIRDIVWDVYYNGVSIPERVMFFRTDYYHAWEGAVDEFAVGNVYFNSSRWCEG